MEDCIIKVENLSKRFDEKVILDKVNLGFRRGESVAIIGNNGSGKSTFLKMLCGVVNISSGKVIGIEKLKFNYIPENYSKLNLTVEDYMRCMAEMEGIHKEEYNKKINELYKVFFMENMKDVPMKYLSKGSLQKVAVLQALLIKPDVLLLDEPLSGQDINSQKNFIKVIKELIADKVTVIMSCHEMFLGEELSERVLKIEDKNIIDTPIENLKKSEENIMIFNRKGEEKDIDGIVGNEAKIFYDKSNIKVVASRNESNKILLNMLRNGYELKYFNNKGEKE